jgi:hypothetical protein
MTTDRSSRRNSRRGAIAAALVVIACVPALAHRRDEYLQAARIGVDPHRIALELDVTPGIAIAPTVVAEIDRDRDGRITDPEARAYAARIQAGLRLEIDGRPLSIELVDLRWPEPIALTRGEGTIQIALTATLPSLDPGRHRLHYQNDHHPSDAAYLANALAPSSPRVAVRAQQRDADQRTLTIDYALDEHEAAGVPWLLVVGLAAEIVTIAGLGLVVRRLRRGA